MQHETVDDGNNYHFPINFATKRTKKDIWDKYLLNSVFIACFILLVGCWLSPVPWFEYLLTSISYCYCFYFSLKVLSRFTSFRGEYSHLESGYEGRILFFSLNATTVCLWFSVLVIAIREIIGALITKENIWKYITVHGICPWLCSFSAIYFFMHNIQMKQCHLNTVKLIDELKELYYCLGMGSGMAHSFFHGYLNIILPCTGDQAKGLKEQIEIYESKNTVVIPSKKLHILIPSSTFCPTSLVNCSNIIESAKSLEWRIKDVAGVLGRPYKNSVYKLIPDENEPPVYVCAEYATPLLTLYKVMNYNSDDSRLFKKYQTEIVNNFYQTLDKIIKENRDCRDLVELIYYKDVDNDGHPLQINELDIGLLLLEKINQNRSNSNA